MDKEKIKNLKKMCNFHYKMEEGHCTEISFFDPAVSAFGGTIRKHSDKKAIIKAVAAMPYLKHLNLTKCKVGNIPYISSTSLQSLYLGSNDIDFFPKWIKKQSSLQVLNLGANNIEEIPDLYDLPLVELKLHKNRIARFPGIRNGIKQLNLFINRLDNIPREVYELDSLEVFTFGFSKIDRLANLASLRNLKWLTLALTNVNKLPEDICQLKNLIGLQLPKNELIEMPEQIGDLDSLNTLTLYCNKIKKLPESFFCLKLKKLSVEKNPLLDRIKVLEKFSDIELYI